MLEKNQQPPTAPDYKDGGRSLVVHSIFPTIQGEGPFAGRRAVFVRLAHCNLQCPGCDTEYTEGAQKRGIEYIFDDVIKAGAYYDLVVITGGEPFRQDIRAFVRLLHRAKFDVQIETNGILFPWDVPEATIVVSPKTNFVHSDLQHRADAYKYVVKWGDVDLQDGLPIHALDHKCRGKVARPPCGYGGTVYVQPMDVQEENLNALNLKTAVEAVQNHGYTLCLQMHKYAGVA